MSMIDVRGVHLCVSPRLWLFEKNRAKTWDHVVQKYMNQLVLACFTTLE